MSLIKRLSTLPEAVRRHLAGEAAEPSIQVGRIEVTIPPVRIAQFGYGDEPDLEDLEDDAVAPGVH